MAGDVYKTEAHILRNLQMRESQIYGNTALLFLLEPVGIDAREGSH
jgi:hypothetical protein